jgi:hypothetical protein
MLALTRTQVWIAAIWTLIVYSYLFKDNVLFRIAEHTIVPLTVANAVTVTIHSSFIPRLERYVIGQGWWWFWIFFALGLLYYARYLPARYSWLYRYPVSISIGWSLGAYFTRNPRPYIKHLIDVMRPLNTINNLIFFIAFATCMMYFFFTVGTKNKAVTDIGRIGRYILMISFGASFGTTIQGRISLFLARLSFLLTQWIGLQA